MFRSRQRIGIAQGSSTSIAAYHGRVHAMEGRQLFTGHEPARIDANRAGPSLGNKRTVREARGF